MELKIKIKQDFSIDMEERIENLKVAIDYYKELQKDKMCNQAGHTFEIEI